MKLKQKTTLIKKIKYWCNEKEIIKIANAHINGNLQYGITLWSNQNIRIIEKIEKIRLKIIEIIFGKEKIENLNDNEKLKLLNWKTIKSNSNIANNIRIHKILNNKKPRETYEKLTKDRNSDEVKYCMINMSRRYENDYNSIPFTVRNTSIKNFKNKYKRYRGEIMFKPIIRKNYSNEKYYLVWPGVTL